MGRPPVDVYSDRMIDFDPNEADPYFNGGNTRKNSQNDQSNF
jgi:hypothetical protein